MNNPRFLIAIVCLVTTALGCTKKDSWLAARGTIPNDTVDAHVHFDEASLGETLQPSEAMLRELASVDASAAIVHVSAEEDKRLTSPLPTLPIKLVLCAPATPDGPTITELDAKIRAGIYQCLKIYLGYVPKYPNDDFYTPYYQLAEQHGLPVVLHTGDTYDKMAKVKFADPLGVDEIAVTYPKITFVIAHLGNPWFHSAAEVVYKNDNVYVDVSAILLDDVAEIDPETVEDLLIKPTRWVFRYVENPEKFLFGSDWPLSKISSYRDAVLKAIPQEHWGRVLRDNAKKVFKIEP